MSDSPTFIITESGETIAPGDSWRWKFITVPSCKEFFPVPPPIVLFRSTTNDLSLALGDKLPEDSSTKRIVRSIPYLDVLRIARTFNNPLTSARKWKVNDQLHIGASLSYLELMFQPSPIFWPQRNPFLDAVTKLFPEVNVDHD